MLIAGIISRATLGSKTGSLIHVVASEYDHDVIKEFYSSLQMLVNNYLLVEGHSLGIADTIVNTDTYNSVSEIITQVKVCVVFIFVVKGAHT